MILAEHYASLSEPHQSELSYKLWHDFQNQTFDDNYLQQALELIIQHPFYLTHDEFEENMIFIQHLVNQYEKNDIIYEQLWRVFETLMKQEHANYKIDLSHIEDSRYQKPESYSQIESYQKLDEWQILSDFRTRWLEKILQPYRHYYDPVLSIGQPLLDSLMSEDMFDKTSLLEQFSSFFQENKIYFLKSVRNAQASENPELQKKLNDHFKRLDGADNELLNFFCSLQRKQFYESYLAFFTHHFELYSQKQWSVPFFSCSSKLPEQIANSYYEKFDTEHFNYLCTCTEHSGYSSFISHFFNENLINVTVMSEDSKKIEIAFTHLQKLLSNLESFDYAQLLIHAKNHPAKFEHIEPEDIMSHYLKYLENKSRQPSIKDNHLNFKSLGAWNLATRLNKNLEQKIPHHPEDDAERRFKI